MLLLWWMLFGIDWPYMSVSSSFFAEAIAIMAVAQICHRNPLVSKFTAAMAVMLVPMAIRQIGIGESLIFLGLVMLPAACYIVYSVFKKGLAIDFNRVLMVLDMHLFVGDEGELSVPKAD